MLLLSRINVYSLLVQRHQLVSAAIAAVILPSIATMMGIPVLTKVICLLAAVVLFAVAVHKCGRKENVHHCIYRCYDLVLTANTHSKTALIYCIHRVCTWSCYTWCTVNTAQLLQDKFVILKYVFISVFTTLGIK